MVQEILVVDKGIVEEKESQLLLRIMELILLSYLCGKVFKKLPSIFSQARGNRPGLFRHLLQRFFSEWVLSGAINSPVLLIYNVPMQHELPLFWKKYLVME